MVKSEFKVTSATNSYCRATVTVTPKMTKIVRLSLSLNSSYRHTVGTTARPCVVNFGVETIISGISDKKRPKISCNPFIYYSFG